MHTEKLISIVLLQIALHLRHETLTFMMQFHVKGKHEWALFDLAELDEISGGSKTN